MTSDITIRVGLELSYEAAAPTPVSLLIQPRLDPWQHLQREQLSFSPDIFIREAEDVHGNIVRIFDLPAGRTTIRHDALVAVPTTPEDHGAVDGAVPLAELTPDLLRYTLPSRYCDSDRLMDFAFEKFGQVPHGLQRYWTLRWTQSQIARTRWSPWGTWPNFSNAKSISRSESQ